MNSTNQKAERALVAIVKNPAHVTDVSFWVNPTNSTQEKRKVLEALDVDQRYDPKLEYAPLTFNPHDIFEQLNDVRIDESEPWGELLSRTREYCVNKVLLIAARGNKGFGALSELVYTRPDNQLCTEAIERLQPVTPPKEHQRYLWPEEVLTRLRQELAKEKFKNWNVQLRHQISLAELDPVRRMVWVDASPAQPYTNKVVDLLKAHEIKTHVRRFVNGLATGHPLLALGTAGYLELEEGLAVYQEMQLAAQTSKINDYLLLTIAVCRSTKSSFSDTVDYLQQLNQDKQLNLSRERIVNLALRSKRGLNDTSDPGANAKDLLYFSGLVSVQNYLASGQPLDRLFNGKIALIDLPVVEGLKLSV